MNYGQRGFERLKREYFLLGKLKSANMDTYCSGREVIIIKSYAG